jgi:hypothetical protein
MQALSSFIHIHSQHSLPLCHVRLARQQTHRTPAHAAHRFPHSGCRGLRLLQVRELLRGHDTAMGRVASEDELFLTDVVTDYPLDAAVDLLAGPGLLFREWGRELRLTHFIHDEARR